MGMSSMIKVDGMAALRLMGLPGPAAAATQVGLARVTPTTTTYNFTDPAERVAITLSFVTPIRADDLETSRPATYLRWSVESLDGEAHAVEIYFDIDGEWAASSLAEKVIWGRVSSTDDRAVPWDAMWIGTLNQRPFTAAGLSNRINWGRVYTASTTKHHATTTCLTGANTARSRWMANATLPKSDDATVPRAVDNDWIVAATAFACDVIAGAGAPPCERSLVIVYDDVVSVLYDHKPLQAWWRRNFTNESAAESLIADVLANEDAEIAACDAFDVKLIAALTAAGGVQYAEVGSLAYRQTMAANVLVALPSGEAGHMSRECGSGDDILTADVIIDSLPFFLFFSTEWIKAELRPLLQLANNELRYAKWPHEYAPHDLGKYPIANAYDGGAMETMPLEESGNLLVMLAAIALRDNATKSPSPARARSAALAWLDPYWGVIQGWADYCAANGTYPAKQLSSDDFDGPIANRSNLAAKAIIGVAAFAEICRVRGDDAMAKEYRARAESMVAPWLSAAIDPTGTHITLQYGGTGPAAFGLQYNLWFDDLLGLNLFNGALTNGTNVHALQKAFYKTKTQTYGIPLDGRHNFTVQPWATWISSGSLYSRTEFEESFAPTWQWLNTTLDRWPMSDWYRTDASAGAKRVGFEARSMWGGVYSRLFSIVPLTSSAPTLPPSPPPLAPPAPPPMNLVLLKKQQAATGAACLDGSPPGFYWEAGTGADANKWVVFLNGGGWCYTLAPSPEDPFGIPGGPKATGWGNADSCWGRSKSGLGSSLPAYHPPTAKGGWLANTPMTNWSKANVIYCDGTSFGGNRDELVVAAGTGSPAAEQNRTLYFRGQRNLDAVLDELKSRGMASAEMAVLSGCSAGGLGALVQCDHFAAALPGVKNKRCIGDAGVFIDATSLTSFPPGKQSVMQKQFGNVVAMSNASLPPACLAGPRNTFLGACFFPENVLPTQTTPTFVRNSFYNYGEWEVLPYNWHNSHNFTPGLDWRNPYAAGNGTCVWEQGRSSNSTADGCSVVNHATMRRFQEEFSAAVAPAMEPASKHGAFIDNCATCHCQGIWNGRLIDGVREADALEGWLLHGQLAKFEAKPIL